MQAFWCDASVCIRIPNICGTVQTWYIFCVPRLGKRPSLTLDNPPPLCNVLAAAMPAPNNASCFNAQHFFFLSRPQNVPAAHKDNDEDGNHSSFRGRATSVDPDADMRPNLARLDSTPRDVLRSDALSMQPLSPADTASTLDKGFRLGRMSSFMSASEGHGVSVLQ